MSPSGETIKCSACVSIADGDQESSVFENEDRLLSHIATQHVFWIPFECVLCPMMCSTENVLKRHYQQSHMGMVPKAIYTYEELKKREMRRIFTESKALRLQNVSAISNRSTNSNPFLKRSLSISQVSATGDTGFSQRNAGETAFQHNLYYIHQSTNNTTSTPQFDQNMANNFECKITDEISTNSQSTTSIKQDTSHSPENECVMFDEERQENTKEKKEHQKERAGRVTTAKRQKRRKAGTKVEEKAENEVTACSLCGMGGLSSCRRREMHLWRAHMSRPPIECRHCVWGCISGRNSQPRDQRRHVMIAHREMASLPISTLFTDNRQELKDEFQKTFGQAFNKENVEPKNQPIWKHHRLMYECKLCNRRVVQSQKTGHIRYRHMSQRQLTCNLCPYGSTFVREMKRHTVAKHKDVIGISWTDNTRNLDEEYKRMFRSAFGSYNQMRGTLRRTGATISADGHADLAWCSICGRNAMGSKGYHVWMQHMRQKRFSCNSCRYQSSFMKLIREHVGRHSHKQVGQGWTDATAELMSAYETTYRTAFGGYGSSIQHPKPEQSTPKQTKREEELPKPKTDTSTVSQGANECTRSLDVANVPEVTDAIRPELSQIKDWCHICRKTFGKNANKSIHIWIHHVTEKRFSCNFCSFAAPLKSGIVRHAQKDHSGETDALWKDNYERLGTVYRDAFRKAFGSYGKEKIEPPSESNLFQQETAATKEANKMKIWCSICKMLLKSTSSNGRSNHIWRDHISQKRYTCKVCGHGSCTPSNKLAHGKSHGDQDGKYEYWDDHTKKLLPQYVVQYRNAFGNHSARPGALRTKGPEATKIDPTICRLCQTSVADRSLHVRHCHMTVEYKCQTDACDFTIDRNDVKALKRHMDGAHPDVQYTVAEMTHWSDSVSKEYAKLMRKAFQSPSS